MYRESLNVKTFMEKLNLKGKISLGIAIAIMLSFFFIKTLLLFHILDYSELTNWYEYLSVVFFMPFFFYVIFQFMRKSKFEMEETLRRFKELEYFIDNASLISRADRKGKITYVNKKFEEVSKWKSEEVVGKDHNVVNSGKHPKDFWLDMYRTVAKDKAIWNDIVTNKAKDGSLYYVDTYIKANFDYAGRLVGYDSIRQDVTDIVKNTEKIIQKNTFLEHSAKILRHDMHSGINTYMPRGLKSLRRRLSEEQIKELGIEAPLRMISDGLSHTQKVYEGVKEFTNLVREEAVLNKENHNLKDILCEYFKLTSYRDNLILEDLPTIEVNKPLFCTAIDNLVRNGLRYNDSKSKFVKIFMLKNNILAVQDNGRGMTQKEFEELSKPYVRKQGQKETGTGLGINICKAILDEHGFTIKSEKKELGTILKIKIA